MMTKGAWWLLRRLLLPIMIATLASAFVFALSGKATIGDLMGSADGVGVIALLIAIILIVVTGAAYLFRRLKLHWALRLPLLLMVGALMGFVLIYRLTETVMFANWAIPPAIAASIVWMLFNIDLLNLVKKGRNLG